MGRDKSLLSFGSQTFLEHIAEALEGDADPLLVVLGHHADEIQGRVHLPPSARILRNPEYRLGQLSSLQVAVKSLRDDVSGAILCLVDHPAISKTIVRALLARLRQTNAAIVIPTFRGRRGHPVVFAQRLFRELEEAPLDQGARWVVERHKNEIDFVELEEEGILWDIDRPEDYEALQKRLGIVSAPPGLSGGRS